MAAGSLSFAWTTYRGAWSLPPSSHNRRWLCHGLKPWITMSVGLFASTASRFSHCALRRADGRLNAPVSCAIRLQRAGQRCQILASLPDKGFYGGAPCHKKLDDLSGIFMGVGADPGPGLQKGLITQVAEANARARCRSRPAYPTTRSATGRMTRRRVAGKLPSKAVYEDLVAAIDVSARTCYPVPYQPVSSVGDAVARARQATAGKKPVVPVLQLFVWEPKDRYPTPAESRRMAFLSLVEGAHGIAYYSYGSVTGRTRTTIAVAQPELWKCVKKLNKDIADIAPRLLSGSATNDLTVGKGTPSVKMKLVREKGGALAVVVNSAATRQDAKLIARDRSVGQIVLQDGKQIEVKEGIATLPLEPFAVEVIRWSLP